MDDFELQLYPERGEVGNAATAMGLLTPQPHNHCDARSIVQAALINDHGKKNNVKAVNVMSVHENITLLNGSEACFFELLPCAIIVQLHETRKFYGKGCVLGLQYLADLEGTE